MQILTMPTRLNATCNDMLNQAFTSYVLDCDSLSLPDINDVLQEAAQSFINSLPYDVPFNAAEVASSFLTRRMSN